MVNNRHKTYAPENFYHVYNRGVEKRKIFVDEQDYLFYLSLLKRYLGSEEVYSISGQKYANYSEEVDLLAFALMPNHFHLLFYLKETEGIQQLMHDVSTAYVRYFNDKYERVGPLFQDRFKASLIIQEGYLEHISRYIHLNPKDWRTNTYSSLRYWVGDAQASWLHPERVNYKSPQEYMAFLRNYDDYKKSLDIVKAELASKS